METLGPGSRMHSGHRDLETGYSNATVGKTTSNGRRSFRTTISDMVEIYEIPSHRIPNMTYDPCNCRDFSFGELRKFIPRFTVSFLIFLLGVYINNVSMAWLQKHMPGYYDTKWVPNRSMTNESVVLWDVTFERFPVMDTYYADFFTVGSVVICVIRFVLLPGPLSLRWVILCRYFMILGLLYLCRAFTITATPLPNPDQTCKPRITYPDSIWQEGWAILSKGDITCHDVMFSGHTMLLTTSMLFFFHYIRRSPWHEHGLSHEWFSTSSGLFMGSCVYMAIGYYCIVASRFHYTVDVLVGILISYFVFHSYHDQIQVMWFRKTYLGPFLKWMEAYSKDLILWKRRALEEVDSFGREDRASMRNRR
eukprot:TRINITY_DN1107_c0_g2_i2.p1 TRINITY_DN1107_c0_g2~~TRINITY_DN1107_c0_g2_i2.p1  ORF type:complete len:393 (-),score=7.86 TRINITY_DN1107_c0_g2_i2:243-1337(-)